MDLPIEVKLTRPVVVNEQTYDKLAFDEPDLDAQIAYAELEASFPKAKVNRFWLARLSGVSEAVVGKIKDSDLEAVNAAAEAILGFKEGKGEGAGSGNEPPAK